MSESNYKEDIKLLEYLCRQEQDALIESDKIEFLDDNDNWISLDKFGLSQVPIIFSASKINDENSNIIKYKLNYRLLIPKIDITSKREEYIYLCKNEANEYYREYHSIPNENYEESTQVRYNNEGTNTFSKAKTASTIITYISKVRRTLYIISSIMSKEKKQKSKQLVK